MDTEQTDMLERLKAKLTNVKDPSMFIQQVQKKFNLDPVVLDRLKLYYQYKSNPALFIRSCVYLPISGGAELFDLYKPQERVLDSFMNDHYLVLLKSRQTGFSTLFQAISVYLTTFFNNMVIGVISRSQEEASDFCRKTQNMLDQLPDWLKPNYTNKSAQFYILDNNSQMHVQAISQANPSGALRSKTLSLLIIDEAAFIQKISDAYTGAIPTLSSAHEVCKRKGIPYGSVILSTPNKTQGVGKFYFEMWTKANSGESAFKPHKIHWKEIPRFADDPEWYPTQCALLNNDKNRIAQELDLKFVASEGALFDEEVQLKLQDEKPEALQKIAFGQGRGHLWKLKNYDVRRFYIIGVDTASAAGTDKSTIQVVDHETCQQVMEFQGKMEPKEFAEVVKTVARLVPRNVIVVENTGGYGLTILNELQFDPKYKFNIYGETKDGNPDKIIYGLSTNSKTRPLMLDALHDYVSGDPSIVHSKRLAEELICLVNKGNKIQADAGFNDDLALAFSFCMYVRKYKAVELNEYQNMVAYDDETGEFHTGELIEDDLNYVMDLNYDGTLEKIKANVLSNPTNFKDTIQSIIRQELRAGTLTGNIDVMELWKTALGQR